MYFFEFAYAEVDEGLREVETTKAGKGRDGGTKRMHDVVKVVRRDRKSSVKRCLFYSKIFLSFFF